MSESIEFSNVTATAKGNIYFDGGVVSHTLTFSDGSRKTLGIIRTGSYRFNTAAAEEMIITDGTCRYRLDGTEAWISCTAGEAFKIPANSAFDISVDEGVAQYICSFLS